MGARNAFTKRTKDAGFISQLQEYCIVEDDIMIYIIENMFYSSKMSNKTQIRGQKCDVMGVWGQSKRVSVESSNSKMDMLCPLWHEPRYI